MKLNTLPGYLLYGAAVVLVLFALAACGPAPVTGGESATSSSFKPGHWSNDTAKEGKVSFDLSESGDISNLNMTTSKGSANQSCTMTIKQAHMQSSPNGTFVISYTMEYADLKKQLGAAVMTLSGIPEGKPYEVLRIEGKATKTTLNGKFKFTVCDDTLFFEPNTGPWKAQWEKP